MDSPQEASTNLENAWKITQNHFYKLWKKANVLKEIKLSKLPCLYAMYLNFFKFKFLYPIAFLHLRIIINIRKALNNDNN